MKHYKYNLKTGARRIRTRTATAFSAFAVMALGIGSLAGIFPGMASAASANVVYNNIPNPKPSNVPSIGYEATSTSEFGGQAKLDGTERSNPKVTVLMSSWACKSGTWNDKNCITNPGSKFNHPVTLNIYNVNGDDSPGALIASETKTFDMPYRPTADDGTHCNTDNGTAGEWWDGTSCNNGKAFKISFKLSGVTLPDNVIVGVAYNTSHYGYSPIGTKACNSTPQGCPYDSLNVGTAPSPSVGTAEPSANDAYLNSTWSGAYCDNGSAGTGSFRLDSGCWTGFLPAFEIKASAGKVGPPTTKEQCKNDGWKTFNHPEFKNQGQCIAYVEHHYRDNDDHHHHHHNHDNDNWKHKGDKGHKYDRNSRGFYSTHHQ